MRSETFRVGAVLALIGALVILGTRGMASKPQLPGASAVQLIRRATQTLDGGNFVVTWRLKNASSNSLLALLPLAPAPWIWTSKGRDMNFYEADENQWKFENESQSGFIDRVVARQGKTMTIVTPPTWMRFSLQKNSWRLPWIFNKGWNPDMFRVSVYPEPSQVIPLYRVTLVPRRNPHHYTVTYWFQAEYAVPLGFRISKGSGSILFDIGYQAFSEGPPGTSANPPHTTIH